MSQRKLDTGNDPAYNENEAWHYNDDDHENFQTSSSTSTLFNHGHFYNHSMNNNNNNDFQKIQISIMSTTEEEKLLVFPSLLPKFLNNTSDHHIDDGNPFDDTTRHNTISLSRVVAIGGSIRLALPFLTNFFIEGFSSFSILEQQQQQETSSVLSLSSSSKLVFSNNNASSGLLKISNSSLRPSLGKTQEIRKKLRNELFPICGFMIPSTPSLLGSQNDVLNLSDFKTKHHTSDNMPMMKKSPSCSSIASSRSDSERSSINLSQQQQKSSMGGVKPDINSWWWLKSDSGCPRHGPFSCSCRSWVTELFLLTSFICEFEIWNLKFVGEEPSSIINSKTTTASASSLSQRGRKATAASTTTKKTSSRRPDGDDSEVHPNNSPTGEVPYYYFPFLQRMRQLSCDKIEQITSSTLLSNHERSNDDNTNNNTENSKVPFIDASMVDVSFLSSSSYSNQIWSEIIQAHWCNNNNDNRHDRNHDQYQQQQPTGEQLPPLIFVKHQVGTIHNATNGIKSSDSSNNNSNNKQHQQQQPMMALSLFVLAERKSPGFLFCLEKEIKDKNTADEKNPNNNNSSKKQLPLPSPLFVKFASRPLATGSAQQKSLQQALVSAEEGICAARDFGHHYFSSQYLFSQQQGSEFMSSPSSSQQENNNNNNNNNKSVQVPNFKKKNSENLRRFEQEKFSLSKTTFEQPNQFASSSALSSLSLSESFLLRCSWCHLLCDRQWKGKDDRNKTTTTKHFLCTDCDRILCGCPQTGCHHQCVVCEKPVCGMCSRSANEDDDDDSQGGGLGGNDDNNNSNQLMLMGSAKLCGRCSDERKR